MTNRQIVLLSYPKGMPQEADFAIRDLPMPKLQEGGDVLVKTLYLSMDPYIRGRMSEKPSYMARFDIGSTPEGDGIGEVVESHNPKLKTGDIVTGYLKWAEFSTEKAVDLQVIKPNGLPVTTALDVLGMTGMTAYFGLLDIGKPQAGETVVISAAAGSVGSMAGQIAKIKGARVIGIAGGKDKTSYLTKELHFDVALDYKSPSFAAELKKACPKGANVYFDNVGGDVSDAVEALLARHARIILCGQISQYNLETPDFGPRPFVNFLIKGVLLKGFSINEYQEQYPKAKEEITQWIKEGKIKFRENITKGLEHIPEAFIGLFKGKNIGKQIIKVA